MVKLGTTNHSSQQLVDNIKTVTEALVTKYPGGRINVRSVHLNCGTTSLPLYASLRNVADVGFVSGRKTKIRDVVTDELSTVVGAEVTVTPYGNVRVKRKPDPNWTEDDETLAKMAKDDKVRDEDDEDGKENKEQAEEEKISVSKEKKRSKEEQEESEDEMEDQELE